MPPRTCPASSVIISGPGADLRDQPRDREYQARAHQARGQQQRMHVS